MIVSFDYSYAVDANFANNGTSSNVLIVQADICAMPFRRGAFDRVFCFGVLQHTPNPGRSFAALVPALRPGGELVADVYNLASTSRILTPYYILRMFTRRMDAERLYGFTRRWVDFMWPISGAIRRVPKVGYRINWRLMVPDYSHIGLDGELLREWAYLDCFDALSPKYDKPQVKAVVRKWCTEAGLKNVIVKNGYNGIEIHGSAAPESESTQSDDLW